MQFTRNTKKIYISGMVGIYLIYMLVFFKTRYSVHHPLEILLQNKSVAGFIRHPVSTGNLESKVCPLGKAVAWLFAGWLICRLYLSQQTNRIWSKRLWILFLLGAALMNPNVLLYIIPAFAMDTCFGYSTC